MGQIRWYKRDPDAALSGMFELSLEERGAYNTVLDLIYSKANRLPDDDRWIAGWMRCDVRVWKRIKTVLIDAGKLYVSEGLIRNSRADVVVDEALSRSTSASDAGRASGRSRASKSDIASKENSDLARTDVQTNDERPLQLIRTRTRKKKEESATHSSIGAPIDTRASPVIDTVSPAFAAWTALRSELWPGSRIVALTPARRQKLAARLDEVGPEGWQQALDTIRVSPFLRGANGSWRAETDWILEPRNFTKIMEGNYDDRGRTTGGGAKPASPGVADAFAFARAAGGFE